MPDKFDPVTEIGGSVTTAGMLAELAAEGNEDAKRQIQEAEELRGILLKGLERMEEGE